MHVGLVGFTESNQHGFPAFGAHEGHGSVGFGLEVSISQHTVDLALERRWNAFDDFGQRFFAFKEGEDEGSVDVVS